MKSAGREVITVETVLALRHAFKKSPGRLLFVDLENGKCRKIFNVRKSPDSLSRFSKSAKELWNCSIEYSEMKLVKNKSAEIFF